MWRAVVFCGDMRLILSDRALLSADVVYPRLSACPRADRRHHPAPAGVRPPIRDFRGAKCAPHTHSPTHPPTKIPRCTAVPTPTRIIHSYALLFIRFLTPTQLPFSCAHLQTRSLPPLTPPHPVGPTLPTLPSAAFAAAVARDLGVNQSHVTQPFLIIANHRHHHHHMRRNSLQLAGTAVQFQVVRVRADTMDEVNRIVFQMQTTLVSAGSALAQLLTVKQLNADVGVLAGPFRDINLNVSVAVNMQSVVSSAALISRLNQQVGSGMLEALLNQEGVQTSQARTVRGPWPRTLDAEASRGHSLRERTRVRVLRVVCKARRGRL